MARIIVRNTAVSGSKPTSLVQGELALNVTDRKLYFGSSSANTVVEFSSASYLNPLHQDVQLTGSLSMLGSVRLDPTQDPDPLGLDLDSTVLFQSASNTSLGYDLYIRQDGNLVKWKWVEGIMSTGLLYGGVVTYSGSYVYVSSGSGIIVEHNATTGSEISPIVNYVTWNAITQSISNIATQQVTYLYIDQNGSLQQQASGFTGQQYHNYIPLGAVGHFDYTQITAFGGGVQTAYDQSSQTSAFIDAFGPLKVSGYGITGQAGSLRFSINSGTSFIHGGFYENDPEFPSQINTPTQPTASIAYVFKSGSGVRFDTNGGTLYNAVRPGWYDTGTGITGSVSNNDWTIQRVFSDPKTGIAYIYYGQTIYPDFATALADLSVDPFTEGDTFDFTIFIGFLVLKSNSTDITATDNKIVPAGLFRGSSAGAGGGGGGSTTPGGNPGEIQYNNLGAFGGVPTLTYDGTTLTGTGSFSGSFTGTLEGTASFASTASFLNSTTNAFIQNGNSFGATALLGTNDNQSLALETSGSIRMFISSSGNVGIGTSTPDSYYAKKLVVSSPDEEGITLAGTTTSATNYLAFADGTTGNQAYRGYVAYKHLTDQLAFGSGGTLRATIDNAGNLGIGTNTISARLHVKGSGATSATTALRVENTNASASLVVLDDGAVGIGNTAPTQKLSVTGNIASSGIVYTNRLYSGDAASGIDLDSANNMNFFSKGNFTFNQGDSTSIRTSLYEFSSLNQGFTGTNLEQIYFKINPKIAQSATAAYRALSINVTETSTGDGSSGDGNDLLWLGVNDSNKFKVTSTGSVLIGTTTDSGFKLDVSGSTRITNGLELTGSLTLGSYISSSSFPGTGSALLTTDTNGSVLTQTFRDVAEQTYTGTIAWTGTTAPSGTTNHTYRWSQVGKTVNLNIVLVYSTAGTSVSTVTTALPADCPTPYVPSGQSGAGALISVVSAHLTNTTTIGANIARGGLRINLTNNGYELTATATAAGYKVLVTSVQYFAV